MVSVHLKGLVIPDSSGQLAELIIYITSTKVDLYGHQILLLENISESSWNVSETPQALTDVFSWYDDDTTLKHHPHYCPFVMGIYQSRVEF